MNLFKKTAIAASLMLMTSAAFASNVYIDSFNPAYDLGPVPPIGTGDANSTTGIFNQFGFTQLLTTSVYDLSDGAVTGAFYDTNVGLGALGIPRSGTAMDGITTVNLTIPNAAQVNIDALAPLVPPYSTGGVPVDSESFGITWDLTVKYHLEGVLGAVPDYTSGPGSWIEVYLRNLTTGAETFALRGELNHDTIELANLNLYFDVTFALDNFLFIQAPDGTYQDAHDVLLAGGTPTLHLDTNVDPPIPAANQLLAFDPDGAGPLGPVAVRQSQLDGTVDASIPEPATLALMGLGLFGLGAAKRRRS